LNNRHKDRQVDGWMGGSMDGWKDGWIGMDLYGWI